MLGRHIYRVAPAPDGAWTVLKEGEAKPRGKPATREAAIELACSLAGADQPSRVTIENDDGTIADERSFGADAAQKAQRD
jgi:hypothetical protein